MLYATILQSAANSVDEYVLMATSTAAACLHHFCEIVIACFVENYLRKPAKKDLVELPMRSDVQACPEMIGSIDCFKWIWKTVPQRIAGSIKERKGCLH